MTIAFEDREYFTKKISSSKCEHFNKGFCKQKSQCDKLHPSTDCDNQRLVKIHVHTESLHHGFIQASSNK